MKERSLNFSLAVALQTLALALTIAAIASPAAAAETESRREIAGDIAGPVIDDRQIRRTLLARARKMIEAGAVTPVDDLLSQLDRSRCTLDLPKPRWRGMAPDKLYTKTVDGVVVVSGIYKCPDCGRWHSRSAGGFLIAESGVCVTNYHVVDNDSNHTLVAMTHGGDVYAVKEVLAASHADDVAILALDAPDAVFHPLALSADAPVGSAVSVISHPDDRFFTMTRGIVSRYFRRRAAGHETTMVAVTADFARGSSGCPVIDDHGAVVALVASTVSVYYNKSGERQENLQMVFKQCVPAAAVLQLIDSR